MQLSVAFTSKKRIKVEVKGLVQGVGFRPFVYNLARKCNLNGFVLNSGAGVTLEVEGIMQNIDTFMELFSKNNPPLSKIDALSVNDIELQNDTSFEILNSVQNSITTIVAADTALCADCEAEMQDKNNRRYLYPFINCTNCGPRYSIINKLPYDRKNTSMYKFTMCKRCEKEYKDPTNRRYHAQPISCYDCGPKLKFINLKNDNIIDLQESITSTCKMIKEGKTVAIKGIGGFHLVCDARNDDAVAALRLSKDRPLKPFAIMFKNLAAIEEVAYLTQKDRALLLSQPRPIVIVQKKQTNILSDLVAPQLDRIGVLLAYTPLHHLILAELNHPIVATSANMSDEPIMKTEQEIVSKLSLLTKYILTFDRDILNACDDSLATNLESQTLFLRLARGYTPKNFIFKKETKKKVLAVGANQKNTISLAFDNYIVSSPHIGDLNSIEAFEYFLETVNTFKRFYNFEPDIIVCDKHPNYETTKWAKALQTKSSAIELIQLQHHYAHALACMAEYNLDEEVLAFCFDGTGYGDDGSLWGGEVLIADAHAYERVYSFKEMKLLGSEKAIKNPKRIALALLFELYTLEEVLELQLPLLNAFSSQEIKSYHILYSKNINSVATSSVGRLFDALFAFMGNIDEISFEGQSGLQMEVNAANSTTKEVYSYTIEGKIINYDAMIKELVHDNKDIAMKFINTLAKIVVEISDKHATLAVVLCGGVFQNKLLCNRVISLLHEKKRQYYIQENTPVNDGSISLGQAYYALNNR